MLKEHSCELHHKLEAALMVQLSITAHMPKSIQHHYGSGAAKQRRCHFAVQQQSNSAHALHAVKLAQYSAWQTHRAVQHLHQAHDLTRGNMATSRVSTAAVAHTRYLHNKQFTSPQYSLNVYKA